MFLHLPLMLVSIAAMPEPPPLECSHPDLEKLSKPALRLRRNLVFARRGRTFQSKDLQEHFGRQPWYRADATYTDQRLTEED